MMAIFYRIFVKPNNNKTNDNKYKTMLLDMLFVIPCYLLDFIDYIKKDYKNTPSSVLILGLINIGIIALMYIIPYVYDLFREHNAVTLLSKNLELNKELIFLNNNELNEKVIENRPILQRQILKVNNKLKDTMELHGGYFEEQKKLFGLDKMYNMRKYINSASSYNYLDQHPSCQDATISCSGEYLHCNDTIITM